MKSEVGSYILSPFVFPSRNPYNATLYGALLRHLLNLSKLLVIRKQKKRRKMVSDLKHPSKQMKRIFIKDSEMGTITNSRSHFERNTSH